MTLGARIKQRREEKGISPAELARRAEISKGYVSEIESEQAPRPSADVLYRLATVLGTSIADLLGKGSNPVSHSIPESLRRLAEKDENLTEEDVAMLAQVRFRGEQPATPEDWRFLFESIKRSIRGSSTK